MARVAFLLCTAFVLCLLAIERRQSRRVSLALWIPTIWIMIAGSRPLVTWFVLPGETGAGNDFGSPLDRWTLIGLAVIAIVVIARRKIDWFRTIRRQKWLVVLLAYMFLSAFWSDIITTAVVRWVRELIAVIMALLVMSEVDPQQALISVFRRTAYVLIPFSLLLIKYYSALGRAYGRYSGAEMWTGVTGQKNELGRLCMISILFLLFALFRRWREKSREGGPYHKWADVFIILLGFYLLIGSNSATSIATLGLGVLSLASMRFLQRRTVGISAVGLFTVVLLIVAYGVSSPFVGGSNIAKFTSYLGRDSTLTGRTEVWASVMPARSERSLLGYGFGSFWTDARRLFYEIPTAHNGYLDILLELGWAGLIFYVAWILSCAQQLRRALKWNRDLASLAICLLLMSLIYNATESALNSLTDYMTAAMFIPVFVLSHCSDSAKRGKYLRTEPRTRTLQGERNTLVPAEWQARHSQLG